MTEPTTLYFVARVDVSADSGVQRGYGVFDTREKAEQQVAEREAHMRGDFRIFVGALLETAGQ